jgi:predicted phosphodiesterase
MNDASAEVLRISTEYDGLLFIGDPHVCASPPGFRLDDYRHTVLAKLAFCLEVACERRCLPIILGDLFHVPRDNPNALLVDLMELFRPHTPWVLVGNHDKHEARLTSDVSLAVLAAAGVIRLLDRSGPAVSLTVCGKEVLLGASPDWTPIPREVDPAGHARVVWVTHHDLSFPGYESGRTALREIPGVDLVVNGHIHLPKPPQRQGRTLWLNPGSTVRISRSVLTRDMHPVLTIWQPDPDRLETVEIPHAPFDEVFPPLDATDESVRGQVDESMFIRGLENLAMRRTSEGVGLRAFLETNLDRRDPIDGIIWELYEEVMIHGKEIE